jgi:hypothetical protein
LVLSVLFLLLVSHCIIIERIKSSFGKLYFTDLLKIKIRNMEKHYIYFLYFLLWYNYSITLAYKFWKDLLEGLICNFKMPKRTNEIINSASAFSFYFACIATYLRLSPNVLVVSVLFF